MPFKEDIARIRVEQGTDNPYDGLDNWRLKDEPVGPPPHKDWAHAAARGVMADLADRHGIKNQLNVVEESVRQELVESLTDIIRYASDTYRPMLRAAVEAERKRIAGLLIGIDMTEIESDLGWWETSVGAAFGEGILNRIMQPSSGALDEDDNAATEETLP